jgi:hypothetical protein
MELRAAGAKLIPNECHRNMFMYERKSCGGGKTRGRTREKEAAENQPGIFPNTCTILK